MSRQRSSVTAAAGTCERGPHVLDPREHKKGQFHRLFSVKAGLRVVLCAGQVSADAVVAAEGDPNIVSLCEQPLRVHGPIGTRAYVTLDLGVTYRSGTETFLKVCRASELQLTGDGRHLPEHWERVEALCEQNGHACGVWTDEEIETHRPRIANWRCLLPFVRIAYECPSPMVVEDITELLDRQGDMPLEELGCRLSPSKADDVIPSVALLLHDGRCTADLDSVPFSRGRPIRLVSRA